MRRHCFARGALRLGAGVAAIGLVTLTLVFAGALGLGGKGGQARAAQRYQLAIPMVAQDHGQPVPITPTPLPTVSPRPVATAAPASSPTPANGDSQVINGVLYYYDNGGWYDSRIYGPPSSWNPAAPPSSVVAPGSGGTNTFGPSQ
jgi:hypothetical protein